MPAAGVRFDNVWKKFHRGELHDSLRDLVPALVRRLVGRGPKREELAAGDFWALSDVSFEVRPGHALGIIGPNGAGKSTILKLVSGILRPTRGCCTVHGRIGALIEVSAGFHPDLTGRENVFLQGAIMGMSSANITRKFDAIVEFSGIEEFIDTPVKRYSSGMNARLGFSIAAHLDPEVLIIDEVLAVGDYSFQQRAFDRVRDLVNRDIAVIMVSHQLDRVAELCDEAILLEHGRIVRQGSAADCIAAYVLAPARVGHSETRSDVPVQLESLTIPTDVAVRSGDRIRIVISGTVAPGGLPSWVEGIGVTVRSAQNGRMVFTTSTARVGAQLPEQGPFELTVGLQLNVPAGIYGLEVQVWDRERGKPLPGLSGYLQVQAGPDFSGIVQMNPTMSLSPAVPARSAATGR
jgi:ABC-type polysaccharide/polyol phosphate transport system ATPase subunit